MWKEKLITALVFAGLFCVIGYIGYLSYVVHCWGPRHRDALRLRHWDVSELEIKELPEGTVWARPKLDAKPEHWEYFNGNEWKFGLKADDGKLVLVEASIRPHADL